MHRNRIGRSSRITQRREAYRTLRDALEHRLGEVRVSRAVHRSLSTFALGRPLHLLHRKGFAFRLRVALATPRHTQNKHPLPLLLALSHHRTRRKRKVTVTPQTGTEEAHKHMTAHSPVLWRDTVWRHTDPHAQDWKAPREGTPQRGETNGVTIEHRARHTMSTRCPHDVHTMSTRHHVAHGRPAKHAVRRRAAVVFWRVLVGALWGTAQRSPEMPAPLTDELLAPRLLVCLVALDRAKPVQHPCEQKATQDTVRHKPCKCTC